MSDENQDNNPSATVPGAAQLTAAEGGENVAEPLSLAELNTFLGTNYKDKATALASLKETKSFVGKKVEAAQAAQAPVNDPALAEKVQSLENDVFYANNPQYKGHEAIIKAMGSNPSEVVKGEAFKTYFEKVTAADEITKTKSVVSSTARVGQPSSHLDEAVKASNAGSKDKMLDHLVTGIREELDIK